MPRLFVAVEVPAPVRAGVGDVVTSLRAEAPQLKWVDPDKYHLTLVFLGRVSAEQVDAVRAAVRSACSGVWPFRMSLTGELGTFRSGVLWAGLEASAELAALAAALTAGLGGVVDLRDGDRPFRAHLTLARAPKGARVPRSLTERRVPTAAWTVAEVVLMESQLSPAGARYTPDTVAGLGGSGSF